MKEYNHKEIEKKWQEKWEQDSLYKTEDKVEGKENYYTLVEFPYPSGNLHVGHWYAFAVSDIFPRYKRMCGYNVLFPIGFDSFGLPAENAAIKRGLDPKEWTYGNIDYMRNQLKSMGASFDWSREITTSNPDFYNWTQWIFTKLFEKNLAYKGKSFVNWCPSCKTVLANEQVIGGLCERCDTEVEKKEMEEWKIRITDYAERLLEGLEDLDWPKEIKESQKNWIGRSEGAIVKFKVESLKLKVEIEIFTTRADTLFGATYLVLSPEHKEIPNLKSQITNWEEVKGYIEESKKKTEIERTAEGKEKTGVEIKGIKAINPATNEEIPVWVADYVLPHVGTGSVMAVPAHDQRDLEFADKYNLPIRPVVLPVRIDHVNPPKSEKETVLRNNIHAIIKNPKNGKYLCMKWREHSWTTFIVGGADDGENLEEAARREVHEETGYKNLVFKGMSLCPVRAEYYAAHKDENRVAMSTAVFFELENEERDDISEDEKQKHDVSWENLDDLPDNFTCAELDIWMNQIKEPRSAYTGEGVLANSGELDGLSSKEAREKIIQKFGEKKTSYRLRDWSVGRQRYWGCPIPIVYDPDGNPHPVPEEHLPWVLPEDVDFKPTGESPLARSKELKERTEKIFGKGWAPEVDTLDAFVDSSWYFLRYIDSQNKNEFSSKDKQDIWMPINLYSGGAEHTTMHLLYSRFFQKVLFDFGLVKNEEPFRRRLNRGLILGPDGAKMSKSRGNVVDPDEVVMRLGADTVRIYLAFIGPYNEVGTYPWDPDGVVGVRRFLEKVWRISKKVSEKEKETNETLLHQTIKKVEESIESLKMNTAVSQMMILANDFDRREKVSLESYKILLKLLAPFAPHITEELWNSLDGKESVHSTSWPPYDENRLQTDTVIIAIQVNGKVRGELEASKEETEESLRNKALSIPNVSKWLEGKTVKKVIFVKGRLLSFVTE